MAFNGSGVFNRIYSWAQDAANSIDITASRVDTEDSGFATGLSLCVTRDGQGKMTSDFLPNVASTLNLGTPSVPWATVNVSGAVVGKCVPVPFYKLTTTFRTSTVTLADDPDLVSGTLATGTYLFKMVLFMTANAVTGSGFKYQPVFTGTAGNVAYTDFGSTNGTAVVAPNALGQFTQVSHANTMVDTGLGGSTDYEILDGTFVVTVAGVLKLQWAQFSSSSNATNLKGGSYMLITQIV